MKDYFTLSFKVSFFRRILNFLNPKKRRFAKQLRDYVKSVKFKEDNPLPIASDNPDYIGF